MGTKHSYLEDHYRKEGKGRVTFVEFTDIVVDDSILFPTSYGQPNDKGSIFTILISGISGTLDLVMDIRCSSFRKSSLLTYL